MTSTGCVHPLIRRLEPEWSSYLRGDLYLHDTHAMLPTCSYRKIRGLHKLIFTIFYIILLSSPTMAYPRDKRDKPKTTVIFSKDKVTYRTTGCKPLTAQELRTLMGAAFDENKMAIDDDDYNAKRSSTKSVIPDDDNMENYFSDEDDIEDIADDSDDDDDSTISVQNRKFMRRKRDADNDNTNLHSNTEFLYQNMLFDSISKRKSRQKRSFKKSKQFHPAWECEMRPIWRKPKDGYFPTRILDGSCSVQKKCFFGIYHCNPVKYAIKVLKRDPENACRPVPVIAQNTTYEETWTFVSDHVTVACECGLKKGRRKSSKVKKNWDMYKDKGKERKERKE